MQALEEERARLASRLATTRDSLLRARAAAKAAGACSRAHGLVHTRLPLARNTACCCLRLGVCPHGRLVECARGSLNRVCKALCERRAVRPP